MEISNIVNYYGKMHTPYQGDLVNHLPMGQLAVYKLTQDLSKTKSYSELYNENKSINKVSNFFEKVNSLEKNLGERESYEPALAFLEDKMTHDNAEYYIKKMLNEYPLGMSSGLFHVLIRLAYAYEGYQIDSGYLPELRRAVAYYVTAYREAHKFSRKIKKENIIKEAKDLYKSESVKKVLSKKNSLGQKMKALYEDKGYMEKGFIIEGDTDEKLEAVLNLSLNSYLNSKSIVALHCITGTHALIVLKDFQKDFNGNIDILTSCIITHLIASELGDYKIPPLDSYDLNWEDLNRGIEKEKDVHAVKLAYTAQELNKIFPDKRHMLSAANRSNRT